MKFIEDFKTKVGKWVFQRQLLSNKRSKFICNLEDARSVGILYDASNEENINDPIWNDEATKELKKIPFFVRGKARRNTEKFALDNGYKHISKDVLYEAKAHYAR